MYLYNAIKTPDGTILESHHRHDYVFHRDANGRSYAVDGGHDYLKRSCEIMDYEELSLTIEDSHSKLREVFGWFSYGKTGKEKRHKILLKNMDTDHILAVLDTQKQIKGTDVETLFRNELKFRGDYYE